MCFWKFPEGQGWSPDHPDSRHSLSIFISALLEATSAFMPALFRPYIFPNLIEK